MTSPCAESLLESLESLEGEDWAEQSKLPSRLSCCGPLAAALVASGWLTPAEVTEAVQSLPTQLLLRGDAVGCLRSFLELESVPVAEAQIGDLLVLDDHQRGHLLIYGGGGEYWHARPRNRKVGRVRIGRICSTSTLWRIV